MISGILIGVGLGLTAAIVHRVMAKRIATQAREREPLKLEAPGQAPASKQGEQAESTKQAPEPGWTDPLQVGDVIMYGAQDYWLAGGHDLREEGQLIARIFASPGARHGWLIQLDPEVRAIAIADPCPELPQGALPAELPLEGARFSLKRRADVVIWSAGEIDRLPDRGRLALYESLSGEALVVLDGEGTRLALRGEQLMQGLFERIPAPDPDPSA